MQYKLRDYQLNQLDFIRDRLPVADVVSIESPTGSGKSIVILEFVKEWLKDNPLSNVVISTGMNNLVFQFERNAQDVGLDTKVLIGKKAANCPIEQEEMGLEQKVFTEIPCICDKKHIHLDVDEKNPELKSCPFTQQAYSEYLSEITHGVGQLIITNHSSLLAHQNLETFSNVGLLIIDEAHTFTNFYDSYLKLELDKKTLYKMDSAINKLKEPMKSIIKMNIYRENALPSQQIDALCSKIEDKQAAIDVREFFETQPSLSNFIEMNKDSYVINKFYRQFDIEIQAKKILFSATMDAFTLSMFNVKKNNIYIEYKNFVDYEKSKFLWFDGDNYELSLKNFLEIINIEFKENNQISGLALSTTIYDMNTALSLNGFLEFKMYNDLIEFKESKEKKKLLCGSRLFFQGVDIPDLDFVCLNKIPFPLYDDKMRAQQDFLTNKGTNDFDSWGGFTVPKVENDILQSSGRLWRKPDAKGIFAIFDSRIEKFKYMIKHTMGNYRHGIKMYHVIEDENKDFNEIKEWQP